MRLLLIRTHANERATFGKLYADGRFLCYTLEDVIREQIGVPVADWKIKTATAIPSTAYTGQPYRVALETSPKYGADCPTVVDVPGFQYIRMHAGNTEGDTEGCILLGAAINDAGIVGGTSRPAVDLVRRVLVMARDVRDPVWLDITNPTEAA
jgi:hypothetical protein